MRSVLPPLLQRIRRRGLRLEWLEPRHFLAGDVISDDGGDATDLPPNAPEIVLAGDTVAENSTGAAIGSVAVSDPAAGDWSTFLVSDSRFEIVAGQLQLKAGRSLNFETEPNVALTITAEEAGGQQLVQSFTLTVSDVNEPPTGMWLTGSSVTENAVGADIGAVTVVDPDAGDSHLFLVSDSRFEVVAGRLRLVAGQSLNYEAEPSVNLTIGVQDAGGLLLAKSFTVTVINVNEPPSYIALSGSSVAEGVIGADLGAVTGGDPDAGSSLVYSVSDSRFEIVGGRLRLKAGQALDYEAESSVSLTITAQDNGGLQLARSFSLTVRNVNEAPTNISLTGGSIAENQPGAVVGSLAVSDPDIGDTDTFQVSDSRFEVVLGQLRLKAGQSLDFESEPSVNLTLVVHDAGGLPFAKLLVLTVTNVDEPPSDILLTPRSVAENATGAVIGTLAAIDPDAGDSQTFAVSDSRFEVAQGQLRLKASQSLDFEATPSVSLTVTAQDSGGLKVSKSIAVTVENVNETPTGITLAGNTVPENAAGAAIGAVAALDPDTGDTHTFTVSDSRFEVTGGQLRLKAGQSLNYEAEPSVNLTLTAIDAGGLALAKSFTLTVTNVNEPPTSLAWAGGSVAENAVGVYLGGVTVGDPDAGDVQTFTVSDSRFRVVNGQLKLKSGRSLDFEAEPSVSLTITARDAGGLALSASFTLVVTNVNEPPTGITLTGSSVSENVAGAVIGAVAAGDPDAGDSLSLSVSDSRFEIVAAQLKLKAGQSLDFETEPNVSLTITAKDASGLELTRPFTLTVTDVSEPLTDILLSATTVPENAPGAVIGNVAIVGDVRTVGVSDPRFEVAAGQLRLQADASLDFEAEPTVSLTLTAADSGGTTIERSFTIQITDANDPPTSIGVFPLTVRERTAGQIVGLLSVTDQDAGQSHTFATSDPRFDVIGSVLKLKPDGYVEGTTGSAASVTVTATDDGVPPQTGTQEIALNVIPNPLPWQNPRNPLDIDNDPQHLVVALDALIIINLLNNPAGFIDATSRLPAARPANSTQPYYDVNGDGYVTSLDALLVINELNMHSDAEGESPAAPGAAPGGQPAGSAAVEQALAAIAEDVSQAARRRRLG